MKKENLVKLIEEENFHEKIKLDDIPEIDLYMDQVIQLFESKLSSTKRKADDKVLTKTMINNYAKAKLLMSVKNKKYSKEHLLLMSLIYELKGGLSINDIKLLIDNIVKKYESGEEYDLRKIYNEYLKFSSDDSEFVRENVLSKIDLVFGESNEVGYEQKLLMITSMISMSNMYRKIGELLIDNLFEKGEK